MSITKELQNKPCWKSASTDLSLENLESALSCSLVKPVIKGVDCDFGNKKEAFGDVPAQFAPAPVSNKAIGSSSQI